MLDEHVRVSPVVVLSHWKASDFMADLNDPVLRCMIVSHDREQHGPRSRLPARHFHVLVPTGVTAKGT